jgi:hypothetical protein
MYTATRPRSPKATSRTPTGATPSSTFQTQRVTELRLSATLGQEPEIEVALVQRLGARALLTGLYASRGVRRSSSQEEAHTQTHKPAMPR